MSTGEFGRVCEIRKFRVNVGKSKVMMCSRHGNGGPMHVILNGEPLEQGFLTFPPPFRTSWHCIQHNENSMYAGPTKAITGSVLNKSQARK